MGTGVVGQVYGAHLQLAGHRVTFLTREQHIERFKKEGITLYCVGLGVAPFYTKKIEVKESQFITELTSLEGVDYVFACFRGEQRSQAARILEPLTPDKGTSLVLCFPFWSASDVSFAGRFQHSYAMLPGISGIYKAYGITDTLHPHIHRSTGRLCPVFNQSSKDSQRLTALLTQAGLPTVNKPNLMTIMDILMAASFPFFGALSTMDYKVSALKDKRLLELAFRTQKECIQIVQQGGVTTGLVGKFLRYMPVPIMTSVVSTFSFLIRGLAKEMLEVHFKKVHNQTVFLLQELASFPFAQTVKQDNLQKLLAMITRRHEVQGS